MDTTKNRFQFYAECVDAATAAIWADFFSKTCHEVLLSIKQEREYDGNCFIFNNSINGLYLTLIGFGSLESIRILPQGSTLAFTINILIHAGLEKKIISFDQFPAEFDENGGNLNMTDIDKGALKKLILYLLNKYAKMPPHEQTI